jgi:hypothetical protein
VKIKKGDLMKKITLFLLTNLFICTGIKSMENWGMEIEQTNKLSKSSNTSEHSNTTNQRSKKSNRTDKLLKQNNILLHTLIMQNKIHFEYEDDQKYTTHISINEAAKNTKAALDNLYKSTNEQLKDKTLYIPMMGETEKPKVTNFKKEKTEDFV